MKLQLKLMALTLGLFSFVNAADVTDDMDALLAETVTKKRCEKASDVGGNELNSKGSKVLHLIQPSPLEKIEETQLQACHAKRKEVLKAFEGMGRACKNVSGAVWDYASSGDLVTDLHGVRDWALSEDSIKKLNIHKDRAYGLCQRVGVTVPGYALATAGALLLDSVSLELFFESTPWAMVAGGTLCYVASFFTPSSYSKKPVNNPRVELCKEELRELLALQKQLKDKETEQKTSIVAKNDDSSSDDEDDVKKSKKATFDQEVEEDSVGSGDEDKVNKADEPDASDDHGHYQHHDVHPQGCRCQHDHEENDDDSALSLSERQTAVKSK